MIIHNPNAVIYLFVLSLCFENVCNRVAIIFLLSVYVCYVEVFHSEVLALQRLLQLNSLEVHFQRLYIIADGLEYTTKREQTDCLPFDIIGFFRKLKSLVCKFHRNVRRGGQVSIT